MDGSADLDRKRLQTRDRDYVFAYLLKAHKNPDQVRRMVERFHVEGAHFLLTIDKHADVRAFRTEMGRLPSHIPIHWIRPLQDGRWCGPGLVQSSLQALEYALNMTPPPAQILQISGQCYPIKPPDRIRSYLLDLGDRFLMRLRSPSDPRWRELARVRLEKYHYCLPRWLPVDQGWREYPLDRPPTAFKERLLDKVLSHIFPLPRKGPSEIQTHFGHAFWSLSRDAASYVLEFHQRRPDLFDFHKRTFVVDEVFIQTVIATSAYWRERATQTAMHYCDWSKPRPPAVLTMNHREALRETPCLTARKFDVTVDNRILDWIDHHLLGR